MASKQGRIPIRRDNLYRLGDRKLPSVTDICSAVAKPFLINWAAKMAAKAVLDDPYQYDTAEKAAAAVQTIKSEAAGRGKFIHDLIESWANGKVVSESEVPEHLRGYNLAFTRFVKSWNPTPVHTEVIVYNETVGYAGRLDLICQIGGVTWLVDFKTSKSVYYEYALQQSAYKNAEFMWVDAQSIPMPGIDMCGIVLLGEKGVFDFKTVDEPFEVFVALKTVWSAMRHNGVG